MRLTPEDFKRELLPTLRTRAGVERGDVAAWAKELIGECRARLSVVLPLRKEELEFLTLLNDRGEIAPDLLTSDESMKATIRQHPALLWKSRNVALRGRPTGQEDLV